MNEVGVSLTIIGVIATLISILFAAAAFYISHKRRFHGTAAGSYHVPGTAMPPSTTVAPHATVHTPGPGHINPRPEGPVTASKPLFKKLSTSGMEEPSVADKAQGNVYLWE